ncbi:hypothetical protein FMM68_03875 [Lachnospiraceae bacterium MD329]|nr:hypothetical protein [Lachnospiraceae bacterium MD329]
MNRLTKQYGNGNWTLDASKFPPIDQTVLDSEIRNSEPIRAAVERLAEYEDAEERGQLVHLPCKVGDTAYRILAGMVLPSVILMVADKGNGYFAFLEDGMVVSLCDFGKSVFLTLETAQQALKGE